MCIARCKGAKKPSEADQALKGRTVPLVAEWTHESVVPWSWIVQLECGDDCHVVLNIDIIGVKLLFFQSKMTPSKCSTAQKINKNNQQKSSTMA